MAAWNRYPRNPRLAKAGLKAASPFFALAIDGNLPYIACNRHAGRP